MGDISHARVVGLFTARAAGEAMAQHDEVTLVPGLGIADDRYALGTGHWSDPRWPDQELTLVEAELLEELGLGLPDLRRNVVTRGIEFSDLVGVEFAIGDARLRGVRPCTPCRYIEEATRPGLLAHLRGRGGLRAAILVGGRVRRGDAIRACEAGGGRGGSSPPAGGR
jgi:MOSC domain-containing protein YiiM